MTTEMRFVAQNLIGHLQGMLKWGRLMTDEQFDFTYAPAAPTARILTTHAWQWLVCDRQHIEEADASLHPYVPEAPASRTELCNALEEETKRWAELLENVTDEKLAEVRHQFNETGFDWSVRGCCYHMLQNVIYKHGQLSYIAFAVGLDGTEPYDAPWPNPIYREVFGRP